MPSEYPLAFICMKVLISHLSYELIKIEAVKNASKLVKDSDELKQWIMYRVIHPNWQKV